jgi:hypothetical protein
MDIRLLGDDILPIAEQPEKHCEFSSHIFYCASALVRNENSC